MAEFGKVGKPDASRKPGGEGLPYSDAHSVAGGPVEPVESVNPGKGLGADYEVKGSKTEPGAVKGKGGPTGKRTVRG